MDRFYQLVIGLAVASTLIQHCSSVNIFNITDNTNQNSRSSTESLKPLLLNIYKERSFQTILVVQENPTDFNISTAINRLDGPKVIITSGYRNEFIRTFNADIMVVIIMTKGMDYKLLETAAETLNYMRQTRILLVTKEVSNARVPFQNDLLVILKFYKMTNVLLQFLDADGGYLKDILQLKPYPRYNWVSLDGPYYPQHWRNFHNATVVFFTDRTMTLSYPYEDGRGNLKLNGGVARLILLFGEIYKAHMKMYDTLEVAARTHFNTVNKMVENNLVDLPMTLTHDNDDKWLYKSSVYDLLEGFIMIPSAQHLTIGEIYGILLNRYFFGCIIICTLLFSMVHTLVDYYFDNLLQISNFVMNERFLSGILGQSFHPRDSSWRGLKIVYFLVFFAGLNISTQFASTMNTLMTSPPYHGQIQTYEDLNKSPLKIMAVSGDIEAIGDTVTPILPSLLQTDNVSYYEENRNNFNTTTGYFLVSLSWKVLKKKQQYFKNNIFNIYQNMTLFSFPCALQLQRHSEFKEPLDYLINRVHDLGLADYWYADTFGDMLRTKKVSISPPNTRDDARPLRVSDLFWPWIIVVGGLASGSLVFLMELLVYHSKKSRKIYGIIQL